MGAMASKFKSISELKAAVSEHWASVPAGAAAVKILAAIEAQEALESKWGMGDILALLGTATITPDTVAALAILTQSEFAVFTAGGEFIDELGQRHLLSSDEFQGVLASDTLLHPVTRVEVSRASEHVVPCFALKASLFTAATGA